MRPLIDPATLELLGERVLVKPYQLPAESPGGIIIPDPYRDDRAWHHYEFVKASPKALRRLGLQEIHVGAIIRTRFKAPADTGYDDPADGQRLLILLAEEIEQVQLWKETDQA